ncbi:MAG: NADH-quinone oxidoreductase subunit NuoG [Armatimonadota bacterium]
MPAEMHMATSGAPSTVRVVIDGRWVTVPKGTTVYQAARASGIEIPIFCYHDRMPPLGACRMCLVQVEKMAKLQTSCTLVATDGMVIDTTSTAVKAGQEAMLEFLLINHPLDCPICDKGGECPLQDQTFQFGPGRSRFIEAKRDFAKPVSLGPVLTLDRERCILCWRCVRFGEIIAGDDALKGFERGFTSEINTPHTLPVESKFIGNTIAICPVGALTSTTYRFRSRPWDNQAVASTCTHCGLGCAIWLDVRGGEVTRTRARELGAVNDIWLCDLGFFGHDYVHADDRLRVPLIRRDGRLQEAEWDDALDLIADRLGASRQRADGRVAFLGGRRLSNEDAFVAARFFRQILGTPHLDHRVDAPPRSASLQVPWGLRSSIDEVAGGDLFILVGCDLTEEYPVLWLRIKQAIDRGSRLIIVHPQRLEVRRYAMVEVQPAADDFARSIAGLPAHSGVGELLTPGRRSHIFLGRLALDGPQGWTVLQLAADLSTRVGGTLHIMRGRGNDFGAQRFGLVPGERGWTAPQILLRAASGEFDVLYVAGSDPATAVTDRAAWEAARRGVGFLVVHEAFLSQTAQEADVVLPALVLPEKDGTVTNLEGRTLPLRAAAPGPGKARGDREIFSHLAERLDATLSYGTADEVLEQMRDAVPDLADGMISPIPPVRVPPAAPDARTAFVPQGDRRNGQLTLLITERLFTQGSMKGRCPGVSALAGPPHCLLHPADAARLGIADGAIVRLANTSGTIAVAARHSDDAPRGHVLVPGGFDAVPVHALVRWPSNAAEVEVRPL